jgi:hypothetical protein
MVMAAPERITIEKKSWLGYVAAFILHTYVAYTCAMHLSEWLVFHWFGWVMPIMHVFTGIPATDWYLQHFALMTIVPALLELGAGFSFVARQKRIQLDGEDFYIDLLFYNRKLRRLVVVELKQGSFKPEYKGQMELYLR